MKMAQKFNRLAAFAILAANASFLYSQTQEDPFNQIHQALVTGATMTNYTVTAVPSNAFSFSSFPSKVVQDPAVTTPLEKIHPLLGTWVAQQAANTSVTLAITFLDDLAIPRFPDPADETPGSAAQAQAAAASAQLVASLQQQRAPIYAALGQEFTALYGAQILDTFWLIKGMVVTMPLGAVPAVSARPDVLYVEPENAGDAPPDSVADGRTRINSDPYFNLGDTRGFIGLLDTGLRSTHTLFVDPNHILLRFNCDVAGINCAPAAVANDDCWNHGTSSAAIITGNNQLGNAYRGVTASYLSSYRVYPTRGAVCEGLSVSAAVRGFQYSVAIFDRVIVAEMQGTGNSVSAISMAANHAFDAGAVVIAANGNNGPGAGTVNSPANAHRVIGVGDFDVDTLAQIASQSRGPASQGRYKPDIQTPTNTETASNASDVALRNFSGTSGATPYAGGVANLFRNWLRGTNLSIDPGQVYAQIILSGQNPWPGFAVTGNTVGAGQAVMGTGGIVWWGKVSVANGQTIDIPLAASPANPETALLFDGSLWWPENPDKHNDVDLYLLDNTGAVRALSVSGPSVFERARATGPAILGAGWKIRIRGAAVPNGPQTVYWAARTVLK